jgi:triacylglycerol lipase
MEPSAHPVVIVSGGAAISPFTTPEAACADGSAAGSTDTYLREQLLEAGFVVYTSPANAGPGAVVEDLGFAGFTSPPEVLPAELTVNAVGPIDDGGASLARFLGYLSERYGHQEFNLVAHSMGGLFSRSAMRQLREAGSPLVVRSLTTIGTPWAGGFTADYAAGDLTLADANGDERFEEVLRQFDEETRSLPPDNAGQQVAARYLMGTEGWNQRQAGVLDDLHVTLIGGDVFRGAGRMWPHDGLVTLASALATGVPTEVLPHRTEHVFPDAHSIFLCDLTGLPWERALTWDPEVAALIIDVIDNPGIVPTSVA